MDAKKCIEMTQKQFDIEAASAKSTSGVSGQNVHPPIEPVPDNDWVGETWGLFWPDLHEFDELKEESEKYLKKHYDDKKSVDHPPADMLADASLVEALICPKPKTPTPPPPPPPAVVLRPKKEPAPTVFEPSDVDNDNSKWSWMRSSDKSAGKARFSLSIYW